MRPLRRTTICLALALTAPLAGAAELSWTVTNPTDETYVNEPVRLKVDLPETLKPGGFRVLLEGKEVGGQIEAIDGKRWMWVAATLKPLESARYTIEAGTPAPAKPRVSVRREGNVYILDNGVTAIRVPAAAEGGTAPGPIAGVRLPDGRWVGRSFWSTDRTLKGLTATVVGDGTVFAQVRLRNAFDGLAGVWGDVPSFALVDVALHPGVGHAIITESHEMDVDDYWEFEATAGWDARKALSQVHSGGAGRAPNRAIWPKDLTPLGLEPEALQARYDRADPRVGNTLMWLLPRWSQAYEDGWFFAASNGTHCVGALVARAGQWFWPHVNRIEIRAKPSADYAGFRCPTWKGRRLWLLTVGTHEAFADRIEADGERTRLAGIPAGDYAYRYCFRPLDKILHDYITTWPGEDGVFYPRSINPLNTWRGWIAGSNRHVPSGSTKLQKLCAYQVLIDPDMYGRYRLMWSPENPNFYTDFMRRPLGMLGSLKGHPQYSQLEALANEVRAEDRHWSVTRPSGAGQECPGYYAYAYGIHEFHRKTSWPLGDGRRGMHPGGDTHPPYIFDNKVGDNASVRNYASEDIVGFGVVLRNRPGTERETYLAFKSGPNRMHYHGDQLSLHYAANATPLAVDHHCSYIVRAGQEHMHNRVAFGTDDLPWANMDGHERTIAFKASAAADVAIGQVDSDRLRFVRDYPPEDWDREWPQIRLRPELRYRRTVVLVKAEPQDYVVIRDQYAGPKVKADYCLHVRGFQARRDGDTIDMGGLKLFVAQPAAYTFSRHDWVHSAGQTEPTAGVRLGIEGEQGDFVTVLYPGKARKVDQARVTLAGALFEEKLDKRKNETVLAPLDLAVLLDYDDGKLLPEAGVEAYKFSRLGHVGTATADGDTVKLKVALNPYGRAEKLDAEFTLTLQRKGNAIAGTYTGTFKGQQRSGALSGTLTPGAYSQLGRYEPILAPPMKAIPGGVQVGDDRITFAGGIDDDEATAYVTVSRGGQDVLKVTGTDLDMDRFQGTIGLIVPDAGYPFGRIPDWLIRQRLPRDSAAAPKEGR